MATKKQTRLKVEKYRGERVFVLGGLRLDSIPVYCLPYKSIPRDGRLEGFRLERNSEVFDTAFIEEHGTHGASDYFFGFEKIIPYTQQNIEKCTSVLFSKDFAEGDVLILPFDHRTFRASVIEWWLTYEQHAPKFKKAYARFRKENTRLSKKWCERFEGRYGFPPDDERRKELSQEEGAKISREAGRVGTNASRKFHGIVWRTPRPRVLRLAASIQR